MKYIIVKDRNDEEYGIIFPDVIIHKDVARIHRATDVRVVSAGFCSLETFSAWGESESLRKKSRPEDTDILKKSFGDDQ